jgi:hypothetical protein
LVNEFYIRLALALARNFDRFYVEKRLSEAVLTRFPVTNPDDNDVALQKAGVAYCAARACFIKGHSAPPAPPRLGGRRPN